MAQVDMNTDHKTLNIKLALILYSTACLTLRHNIRVDKDN